VKKLLGIVVLGLLLSGNAFAKKNKNTWDYPLLAYKGWEIKGSDNHYKFKSNLRQDKNVLKEFKNNKETGIISYLLFEDDKIVIDVSDIPISVEGDKIIDGLLPSHSMGKSLVSYVTGHAICEGYIDSVNVRLNDWPLIKNTLYEDSMLHDLLNMKAGDQKWVGERRNVGSDNRIKGSKNENVNVIGLMKVMNEYLRGTEKSKLVYNYSALTTNVILNYVKYKTGDDWEKLLNKVYSEHVGVKNSVYLQRSKKYLKTDFISARYSFYANRYDYLRIAKAMMDDWHNDTCAGKYLKTIYESRVKKKDSTKEADDVGLYTKAYGGQFHFDIYGIKKTRKIIGMSGFAGQQILIDLDNKRIIVVNSLYKNYNWKKIVHSVIKKGI
jgi:glutaredoxin-related protein